MLFPPPISNLLIQGPSLKRIAIEAIRLNNETLFQLSSLPSLLLLHLWSIKAGNSSKMYVRMIKQRL